jgi:hypothetical protein
MTEEFDPTAERLKVERPVPRAGFRGDLRRTILDAANAQPSRPQRLGLVIAAYAGSGLVLLAIAVAGVAGTGPFAT